MFGLYQPLKANLLAEVLGEGDRYDIFNGEHPALDSPQNQGKTFVYKETLGYQDPFNDYPVFPTARSIPMFRPVFLMRDPVDTWVSWTKYFPTATLDSFMKTYKHVFQLLKTAKEKYPDQVKVLAFEHFIDYTHIVLSVLCRFWDIPPDPAMEDWNYTFKENPNIAFPQNKGWDMDEPLLEEVNTAPGVVVPASMAKALDKPDEPVLDPDDVETIQTKLTPLYNQVVEHSDVDFLKASQVWMA